MPEVMNAVTAQHPLRAVFHQMQIRLLDAQKDLDPDQRKRNREKDQQRSFENASNRQRQLCLPHDVSVPHFPAFFGHPYMTPWRQGFDGQGDPLPSPTRTVRVSGVLNCFIRVRDSERRRGDGQGTLCQRTRKRTPRATFAIPLQQEILYPLIIRPSPYPP